MKVSESASSDSRQKHTQLGFNTSVRKWKHWSSKAHGIHKSLGSLVTFFTAYYFCMEWYDVKYNHSWEICKTPDRSLWWRSNSLISFHTANVFSTTPRRSVVSLFSQPQIVRQWNESRYYGHYNVQTNQLSINDQLNDLAISKIRQCSEQAGDFLAKLPDVDKNRHGRQRLILSEAMWTAISNGVW